MAKPQFTRITEPDEGLVHIMGSPLIGNITLCGLTDFLQADEAGTYTDAPCTCEGCLDVIKYVHAHAKP